MADPQKNLVLRHFWQSHIDSWTISGLSQAEYCRQNSLKRHQFAYWKKRLQKEDLPIEFVQIPEETVASIATPGNTGSSLRLTVSSRFTIDVPDNFTPDTLDKILCILGRF